MESKEKVFIKHIKKHWEDGDRIDVRMTTYTEIFCNSCKKDIYQIWEAYKKKVSKNIEEYINMEDF